MTRAFKNAWLNKVVSGAFGKHCKVAARSRREKHSTVAKIAVAWWPTVFEMRAASGSLLLPLRSLCQRESDSRQLSNSPPILIEPNSAPADTTSSQRLSNSLSVPRSGGLVV